MPGYWDIHHIGALAPRKHWRRFGHVVGPHDGSLLNGSSVGQSGFSQSREQPLLVRSPAKWANLHPLVHRKLGV